MATYHAEVEWTAGLIRLYQGDGSAKDESAYIWAAALKTGGLPREVEVLGMDKPLSKQQRRAVEKALADQGFEWLLERRPGRGIHRRRLHGKKY